MSNFTLMAAKIKAVPDVAREEILKVLREMDGNREDTAAQFDVSIRTFYRWVQELRLYEDIDKLLISLNLDPMPGPERKFHKGTTQPVQPSKAKRKK